MSRISLPCAVGCLAVALGGVARADTPITTIYNTGVNDAREVLTDGALGDPHYTIVSEPGGTSEIRIRTVAGGYPIGPWVDAATISAWIGPNNNDQLDGPVGVYDYRTTFNLAVEDPFHAQLTFRWSTDNEGAIYLNNKTTGITIPSDTSYRDWHTAQITTGFVPGDNTLDFLVNNDGGPTGLRVEFLSATVPEPTSLVLLFGQFGILLIAGWLAFALRRQRAA